MGVFEKSFRILFEIIKEPSFFHLTSTMKTFNSFLKAVAAGILLLGVSVSAQFTVGEVVEYHLDLYKPKDKWGVCRIIGGPYELGTYNIQCLRSGKTFHGRAQHELRK